MSAQFNRIGVLACHEYAATVAYKEALNHASETHQEGLRDIQMDHEEAAQCLQSFSLDDCTIENVFGVWELMSKALHGVERLYGRQAALQLLHDCENLAILDYEECLRDNGIPIKGRTIIVHRLIPQARDHANRLKRFIHQSA